MEKYKKYIQIAAIAVAAVWVFCIVFVISMKKVQNDSSAAGITDVPTASTASIETFESSTAATAAPTTTETTTMPFVSIDGNNVTTAVSASTPQWKLDEEAGSEAEKETEKETETTKKEVIIPTEKKDIIDAYISAVNKLKNTENFTLIKTDKLSVTIDDVTGGSAVRSAAQKFISQNSDDTPENYVFSGGKTSDGILPNDVIAPLGKSASLSATDVVSATSKEGSNGAYTVTINLGNQKQTLTSAAPAYSTSMEVFDIDSLGLGSMNISEMDIYYGNSSITAKIDKNGRITSMTHYIEVTQGSGKGRVALVSASVKMHGNCTTTYKITY
ncbi:MAG: hypothetical protein ACI4GY_00190 [Acutalibacteraceae bacterium]